MPLNEYPYGVIGTHKKKLPRAPHILSVALGKMATLWNFYKDLYYKKTAGATHENSLGFESELLIVRCRVKNFSVCSETYFLINRRPIRNLVWEMFCLMAHAQWTKKK